MLRGPGTRRLSSVMWCRVAAAAAENEEAAAMEAVERAGEEEAAEEAKEEAKEEAR